MMKLSNSSYSNFHFFGINSMISMDHSGGGGIVKVGGPLPEMVVLVNFGALIPKMVVIPKGVVVFSLYFSFKRPFLTSILCSLRLLFSTASTCSR